MPSRLSTRRTSEPAVERLARARYLSLRTFRRDGRAVDVPVWFVLDDGRLWFRTKSDTAKVRRIERNASVEVRASDWRGRATTADGLHGTARVLAGEEAEQANRRLHRRYGWKWNSFPLVQIPGTNTVKMELSWKQRWHHLRSTSLWPGSCIVEVTLDTRAS
jgi:PPOX class probable F420-dependent enzyme